MGEADLNPKFRVRISKIAASRLRTDRQTNKQTDQLTGTPMGKFTILKLPLAPTVREGDKGRTFGATKSVIFLTKSASRFG